MSKHETEPVAQKHAGKLDGEAHATEQAKLAEEQQKSAIEGEDNGLDVFQQARLARGQDKDGGVSEENAKKEVVDTRAAEANYTDEQKKADLAKEARVKHLASLGFGPNDIGGHSGGKKVEIAKGAGKMYFGQLTCESVSALTHERISAKMDMGSSPVGEEYVWHAFKQHHPTAIKESFKIDPTNKLDPNLRTRFE